MFILELSFDCVGEFRDPGWNRIGNTISHLLTPTKVMQMYFCMGVLTVVAVSLQTYKVFRLQSTGLLRVCQSFASFFISAFLSWI